MLRYVLLLSCLLASPLYAEDVSLKFPSGLTAFAKYEAGDTNKPAILLLHGFLQTGEFPTVARLADALLFEGYSILLPSLSLGIDKRKNSLNCEALQLHGMDDSNQEIGAWLDFLGSKGHQNIIAIGHSFGSLQVLAYQSEHKDTRLNALILTSLVYVGQEMSDAEQAMLAQRVQQALADKRAMPEQYSLSFCHKYTSLPEKFNSYLQWDSKRTAEAVNTVGIPLTVIIGDKDTRIDPEWIKALQTAGANVDTIVGANHFFDSEHQSVLQEHITALLP